MMHYDHQSIEKKWQDYWKNHHTFKTTEDPDKPYFYALDMFPYPSGQGLHVGHPEGYTATDILARMKRAQGYNVLHPMGWDAFGLPAEQYALDTGNDPAIFTEQNIEVFRKQLNALGFSYDWDREINTTDPEYYHWTQWIFVQLFKRGLAYEAEVPVNWCPALGTVLANEEVIDGKSERGDHPVYRVPMKQWMLKITDYADRLLEDLDLVDWPENIKEMQRNWIGRSEGARIQFKVVGHEDQVIEVFTTRPDTLFGVTYVVCAPELSLVQDIVTPEQKEAVEAYQEAAAKKSDFDRTELAKEKTGIFTGAYAVHPVTGAEVPIWVADYVLGSYGTGAVMAVPAHDERDYEFAKKHHLLIRPVIEGSDIELRAYTEDGPHMASDFLDGLYQEEASQKMIEWLEAHDAGYAEVTYRLRDWLFSRQRYWGEPIPVIHWEDGTTTAVSEEELPVVLPKTDEIQPSGTGESPLANITEWVHVVDPKTGKKGKRETNTMPQWAGSSWYFLRFIDPHNQKVLADYQKLEEWLPVDIYIGGAEHAVLHLLYARFWHKFLYDIGVVPTPEPFQKLFNQGMILGENNEKMSKSRGNVVNPDDVVDQYGADTLRLYEMFMGPLDASIAWSEQGLEGSRKFLDRIWRLMVDDKGALRDRITTINDDSLTKVYHQTVKKVTEDYEALRFNTGISQLMIFINEAYKADALYIGYLEGFLQLLAPVAPHIAEELWEKLGHQESITHAPWPSFDPAALEEDQVEIVVQINGKVRSKLTVPVTADQAYLETQALEDEKIKEQLTDVEIVKVIVVPKKLVNIVVKPA